MTFDLGRWLPEFPIRERSLYLDHAALCPLPRPVAEAMRQRITDQEEGGADNLQEWSQQAMTCRHLGAELIECNTEDISLIKSTSEGLSLIAEGLDWQPGDEVLVGEEEFATNVAPWLNLERHGVKVVRFPQPDGRIDPHEVEKRVGLRTRLLAVSWVAFHTGWIAPLAQLGRVCTDNNVWFVVDGIQALGVLPMRMSAFGVDAVVADAHKWLLGPEGIGLMATAPRLRAKLRPALSGWRNVHRDRGTMFLDRLEHLEDGRRFEPGAPNSVGIAGLAAALDLIQSVEREQIQTRVEMASRVLGRILIAHGWDVYSPGPGHPVAGIVAARHADILPREAMRRLRERNVICSVRQGYLRLSPHFYITKGELEAIGRILEKEGL
jgi:selenocysteine lyase/cysteine desulfurase